MATQVTLIGGIRLPEGANLTHPLVRLEVSTTELRLVPRGLLRSVFRGGWELRKAEIALIRPTFSDFALYRGVEIVGRDHRVWTFWHTSPSWVLDTLESLGYPIRRTYLP